MDSPTVPKPLRTVAIGILGDKADSARTRVLLELCRNLLSGPVAEGKPILAQLLSAACAFDAGSEGSETLRDLNFLVGAPLPSDRGRDPDDDGQADASLALTRIKSETFAFHAELEKGDLGKELKKNGDARLFSLIRRKQIRNEVGRIDDPPDFELQELSGPCEFSLPDASSWEALRKTLDGMDGKYANAEELKQDPRYMSLRSHVGAAASALRKALAEGYHKALCGILSEHKASPKDAKDDLMALQSSLPTALNVGYTSVSDDSVFDDDVQALGDEFTAFLISLDIVWGDVDVFVEYGKVLPVLQMASNSPADAKVAFCKQVKKGITSILNKRAAALPASITKWAALIDGKDTDAGALVKGAGRVKSDDLVSVPGGSLGPDFSSFLALAGSKFPESLPYLASLHKVCTAVCMFESAHGAYPDGLKNTLQEMNQELGNFQKQPLSDDLRACADRLEEHMKIVVEDAVETERKALIYHTGELVGKYKDTAGDEFKAVCEAAESDMEAATGNLFKAMKGFIVPFMASRKVFQMTWTYCENFCKVAGAQFPDEELNDGMAEVEKAFKIFTITQALHRNKRKAETRVEIAAAACNISQGDAESEGVPVTLLAHLRAASVAKTVPSGKAKAKAKS